MNENIERLILELVTINAYIYDQRKFVAQTILEQKRLEIKSFFKPLQEFLKTRKTLVDSINKVVSASPWPEISSIPSEVLDIIARSINTVLPFEKPDPILRPLSPLESTGNLINQMCIAALKFKNELNYTKRQDLMNFLRGLYEALDNCIFETYNCKLVPAKAECYMEI